MAAKRSNCQTQSIIEEMWQEACERGRSLSFKIASGSMRPMIEVGNVVKVCRARPARIRIGDIVAFRDGQNVVVHRIIGKSLSNAHPTFRHMGDASRSSGKIPAQNLIGRVTAIKKERREIRLDSPRHAISNKVLGWRLWLVDALRHMQYRRIGRGLRMVGRPIWRLCQSLLFWRL